MRELVRLNMVSILASLNYSQYVAEHGVYDTPRYSARVSDFRFDVVMYLVNFDPTPYM